MGDNSAIYDLSEMDRSHALTVADRLAATHSGVTARIKGTTVELAGPWDEPELRRIWAVALLNERLVEAARSGRASVLERLVK